ncbi:MAG: hypothetical protein KGJ43_03485 [Acidobacteriota bacterium]|nr:hypothetical protein [Acidobacteriota bacterium]
MSTSQRSRRYEAARKSVRSAPSRNALAAGLVVALLAGAASAPAAKAPAKGRTFRGTTSERGSVTLTLTPNGRRITSFSTSIGYNGKCGPGGGPGYVVKGGGIAVKRNGTFSATLTGRLSTIKPVKVRLAGRISGNRATGSVVVPSVTHCTSGPHKGVSAYSETFVATAG